MAFFFWFHIYIYLTPALAYPGVEVRPSGIMDRTGTKNEIYFGLRACTRTIDPGSFIQAPSNRYDHQSNHMTQASVGSPP